MNTCLVKPLAAVSAVVAAALISGCASNGVKNPSGKGATRLNADEQGYVTGTGIESQDLVAVTDKMARSILGNPRIANAATPPTIVLEPVENKTRFPVDKDLFLTRIRAELNKRSLGKVQFLDRQLMVRLEEERNRKRAGDVTASSDPNVQEFKGADYLLTGELGGSSLQSEAGISDYVHFAFRLTEARTSVIVWEDSAEMKKQGQKDAAYR